MNLKIILMWLLRLVPALILIQTLFFKFSGSEESIYIFQTIGMEPWGRIGTGVFELIASILLLWPKTSHLGALFGVALMSGALFFHLTKLGIEVQGDGGLLFAYAMIVMICCLILVFILWSEILKLIPFLQSKKSL